MNMQEPRTFRASTEAWLGQLLLPAVFFIVLMATAVNQAGLNPAVAQLILAAGLLVAIFDFLLPMLRNWLYADSRSFEGSINGRYFQIYWTEVIAVWVVTRRWQHFLCLGTRNGTLVLPLRFFDHQAVWRVVQRNVPDSALDEQAIQELPDFQIWDTARRLDKIDLTEPRAVADHWLIQVLGWAGLTFFLFYMAEAIQAQKFQAALACAFMSVVSSLSLIHWGVSQFGPQRVERQTMFGKWVIDWDEVRRIEVDPLDTVIALVGEDSRLVLSGPVWWGRTGKREALAALIAQAERRHIPLRRTVWVVVRFPKGTRIKNK